MARIKRKLKNRSRAHVAHVKAGRKKRLRSGGGQRTANSRSRRRLKRHSAKGARN